MVSVFSGICPVHCQVHKEQYVDLQAVFYSATLDEKRYRICFLTTAVYCFEGLHF